MTLQQAGNKTEEDGIKVKQKQVTLAQAKTIAREIGFVPAMVRKLDWAHSVGTGIDSIVMNYPETGGRITIRPDRTTKDMFLIIEETGKKKR